MIQITDPITITQEIFDTPVDWARLGIPDKWIKLLEAPKMTPEDKQNHRYVLAEKELFQALYEREKWYASELLKSDASLTEHGRALIQQRMLNCILSGFGAWAGEQVKQQAPE